ncbi:hypothetical protein PVK06_020027 [Gossypium arboreum]|uniref:Uncharacterized protein n=1 Tax=Gossypium arboreum TaxID=29729 RepID=A0ABR0PL96_GOSAR|nr:hypothetical protein PVK06_020027 [Gossypium arboreum]
MSLLCFRCGRFRYSCDACLHRSRKRYTTEGVAAENLNKDEADQGGSKVGSSVTVATTCGNDEGDQFGPWIGSRPGILSESHMEVEGVKPVALNGNIRTRGSYEEILGKDLLAREKLLFNPQIKRLKKNKGKSVILVNGPKVNSNVIKPVNKQGSLSGSISNPFDDG